MGKSCVYQNAKMMGQYPGSGGFKGKPYLLKVDSTATFDCQREKQKPTNIQKPVLLQNNLFLRGLGTGTFPTAAE